MTVKRADDLPLGKSVLERILYGIRSAELVIADLSGRNANVFYELGLAHAHTKNVLLLTQKIRDVPFDLRHLFCHQYSRSDEGLKRLAVVVRKAAKNVRARTVPAMLDGVMARTRQIIEYMDRQLTPPLNAKNLIIRAQAGFSSVANPGYPNAPDKETRDYGQLLLQECVGLMKMLTAGAILRAIIFPPVGPWEPTTRWYQRYQKLLDFLREEEFRKCEFVVSTEEGPNLLFYGEDILFEGHKTGIEAGYGWTMVYTDQEYLRTRLTIFDMLFQSGRNADLRRNERRGHSAGLEGSGGGRYRRPSRAGPVPLPLAVSYGLRLHGDDALPERIAGEHARHSVEYHGPAI